MVLQSRQRTRSVCSDERVRSMWRQMRPARRTCGSDRRLGGLRFLDVAGDLGDELLLALEGALVAQASPKLEHEPLAVEVAFEVEEVRLDAPFAAAVMRI